MTPEERIAKLEALLARVLARKRNGVHGALAKAPPPAIPPTPLEAFFSSVAPAPPPAPPTTTSGFAPAPHTLHPSATPPRPVAPPTVAPSDASLDRTIAEAAVLSPPRRSFAPEVSEVRPIEPPPMEVIELEIDPDPSLPPPPASAVSVDEVYQSRSRLVTAPPSTTTSFDAIDDDAIAPLPPSDPTIEVGAVEVGPAELAGMGILEPEHEEPAPSSSRRPISMEEKMAEEDDAVPLHAAPPKSGPLPAATPAIELGFEADVSTGVRRYDDLLAEAARESRREAAEVAHADAPTGAEVARFVGQAPRGLAAVTFGELLDAALEI